MVRRLTESISLLVAGPSEKRIFPLKVLLEVTNSCGVDIVLHSGFFRFADGVKPHPALRCIAGGQEAELFFPGKDNTHSEREFLLKARHAITTFTALSPSFDATKIQSLMTDRKVGVFRLTGCWLGDTPSVRHYRFAA